MCHDRYHAVAQAHNFGAESHLVVEIQALLSRHRLPLFERSSRLPLPVQLLQRAHKDSDHTAVIAVIH